MNFWSSKVKVTVATQNTVSAILNMISQEPLGHPFKFITKYHNNWYHKIWVIASKLAQMFTELKDEQIRSIVECGKRQIPSSSFHSKPIHFMNMGRQWHIHHIDLCDHMHVEETIGFKLNLPARPVPYKCPWARLWARKCPYACAGI